MTRDDTQQVPRFFICFTIQIQGVVVSKIGMCVFPISVYPGRRETDDILCGDFIIQPINEQKKKWR